MRLKSICTLLGGYAFKSTNYTNSGVRVIRISDFNEEGFIDNNCKYYEEDDTLADYLLKQHDILLCMTGGTVGKSYHIDYMKIGRAHV